MTPLVPPTPSPLFPPNLSILVSLGPDEVKALVREYGLTSDNDDDGAVDDDDLPLATKREARKARPVSYMTNVSDAGQSWVEAGLDGTREDELNKFMRYIGVSRSAFSPRFFCIGLQSGSWTRMRVSQEWDAVSGICRMPTYAYSALRVLSLLLVSSSLRCDCSIENVR